MPLPPQHDQMKASGVVSRVPFSSPGEICCGEPVAVSVGPLCVGDRCEVGITFVVEAITLLHGVVRAVELLAASPADGHALPFAGRAVVRRCGCWAEVVMHLREGHLLLDNNVRGYRRGRRKGVEVLAGDVGGFCVLSADFLKHKPHMGFRRRGDDVGECFGWTGLVKGWVDCGVLVVLQVYFLLLLLDGLEVL